MILRLDPHMHIQPRQRLREADEAAAMQIGRGKDIISNLGTWCQCQLGNLESWMLGKAASDASLLIIFIIEYSIECFQVVCIRLRGLGI